jgi:hypothetical protein
MFGKKTPTVADRASRALIVAGDKVGGNVGFKIANAVSGILLNRDWKPCDENCGCSTDE